MGLGLLGRGIGVAQFLAEQGADLLVTDLKTASELKNSIQKLKSFSNIKFVLGEHRLSDFQNCDLVIRAANAPLNSPYLAAARAAGVPIEQDASLFAKLAPVGVRLVGVTGTRGKSTVAHLLYHILMSRSRLDTSVGWRVFLAGNVRSLATLPLLKKVKSGDIVVLELDSWQLQNWAEITLSVAVFTNFMPDHQNYYGGDMERYFADKQNIFRAQTPNDVLIAGESLAKSDYGSRIRGTAGRLVVARPRVVKNWHCRILGDHNLENIACAAAAAQALGVSLSTIKKAVSSFRGVPGRQELIRGWRGRKIYNDTTATTPAALLAALKTFGVKKKLILIAGGSDKNLPLDSLPSALRRYARAVFLLPGTGTVRLINLAPYLIESLVPNLKTAVARAAAVSRRGDVILFSPGFASFGPPPGGFKNEFDRGDQFDRLIKKIK